MNDAISFMPQNQLWPNMAGNSGKVESNRKSDERDHESDIACIGDKEVKGGLFYDFNQVLERLGIGKCAKALDDKELSKLAKLEEDKKRLETILEGSREDRARDYHDLYNAIWNNTGVRLKPAGVFIYAGMFIASVAACGLAQQAGVSPLMLKVMGIGSLLGLFKLFPEMTSKILNKWLIPARVDAKLKNHIKQEILSVEKEIEKSKENLNEKISSLDESNRETPVAETEETDDGKDKIIQDDDFILIDGLRIKKK